MATYPGRAKTCIANHILDVTIVPGGDRGGGRRAGARRSPAQWRRSSTSSACSRSRCSSLADGSLLINELAPRPHNSGHFSFDASVTSQFEQQLRAVCGLPLGCTESLRPAAMANLLGDLWARRRTGLGRRRRAARGEDPSLRQSRARGPVGRWGISWPSAQHGGCRSDTRAARRASRLDRADDGARPRRSAR